MILSKHSTMHTEHFVKMNSGNLIQILFDVPHLSDDITTVIEFPCAQQEFAYVSSKSSVGITITFKDDRPRAFNLKCISKR